MKLPLAISLADVSRPRSDFSESILQLGLALGRPIMRCAVAIAIMGGVSVAAVAQGNPIKIGVVTPNAGGLAVLGNDLARNYELAAEQINANGGIRGRKIQLIRGDATNA